MPFTVLTDLGSFEDVAARGHGGALIDLRAIIARVAPNAFEKASAREGSIWWGTGPRKMTDGVIWAMPYASHLNVGVFDARDLPDPAGLLEGTGAKLRHVKVRAPEDLTNPDLLTLLQAAWDRAT